MSSLNPVYLKTLQDRRSGLNTRSNAPGGQVATSTSTSAFGVPSSAFAKASGDNSQPASITIDESVETYAGGDPTRTVGDTAQPILDQQALTQRLARQMHLEPKHPLLPHQRHLLPHQMQKLHQTQE